ncbi:hypothetical protein V492_06453 [Pseudogymnoascus sp. VKM F-4246]|nr:hypothetical protein V492_06453 [Pseudogymnoascus sp. VKM F-4246]
MACHKPDCSYANADRVTEYLMTPALQPNPDISGTGVLLGFTGIAYVTLILLVLRYLIGDLGDTNLDGSANPIDHGFLSFFWGVLRFMWGLPRKWALLRRLLPPLKKPSARFGAPLKQAILTMSDAQIATGLSILIGGYSQVNCGLSIYHWHMVVHLAWFSSVTHLTTLTFLRRYIHDNHKIRILRLVLMLALMLMVAVALVPTSWDCGMPTSTMAPPFFPGSPAKCCLSRAPTFKGTYASGDDLKSVDKSNFMTMLLSEVLLISSTLTRVIKLFRRSSEFAITWLRHKPARMCRHVTKELEERYDNSNLKSARGMYIAGHCAIMAFMAFARAIYDFVDSILFEILWLLFALSWGTIRIYKDRKAVDDDSAAKPESIKDFVLQENSWGFGQLIPTLLLILPLFSLIEGIIATLKHQPTDSVDDIAATIDEAQLPHTLLKEELSNRAEPQLQSYIHQWPFKTFHRYVYGFGVVSVAFLFLFFGITFLLLSFFSDMVWIMEAFSRGDYPLSRLP